VSDQKWKVGDRVVINDHSEVQGETGTVEGFRNYRVSVRLDSAGMWHVRESDILRESKEGMKQ
jgi:ribosomal protein L21E